ncbi:MAG: hypothetical protein ACXVB0_02885 [Mucilaginibacter sp.]
MKKKVREVAALFCRLMVKKKSVEELNNNSSGSAFDMRAFVWRELNCYSGNYSLK